MKTISILLVFLAATCPAQSPKADTVFLLNESLGDEGRHVIYIDPAGSSSYYKLIANFSLDRFDSLNYMESIAALNPGGQPLKKQAIGNLPRNWCPLYIYKGKYCLFTPPDFGRNLGCLRLSDTTLISYGGEGATPEVITGFEQRPKGHYLLSLKAYMNMRSSLEIVMIDEAKGIAVFGDVLMVNADKVRLYPVIVDDSAMKMVYPEGGYPVKFDEPDIPALLKKAGR